MPRLIAALLVLTPLSALPGGAWGESGRLASSQYPPEWQRVADQAHGRVLVLPWTLYRAFPWAGDRTVLDPATKLLQWPVVNDALPLPGRAVQGEDPLAARLDPLIRSGRPLRDELAANGVSQVLVERTASGDDAAIVQRQVEGLSLVVADGGLVLYDVGPHVSTPVHGRRTVLAGDAAAGVFCMITAAACVVRRRRTAAA